jgi:hypothetical protein
MIILGKLHLPWHLPPLTIRPNVISPEVKTALDARLPKSGYNVSSPSAPCSRCESRAVGADTLNVQAIGLWHGRAHIQIVPNSTDTDLEVHPVFTHHVEKIGRPVSDGSNKVQAALERSMNILFGSYAVAHKVNHLLRDAPEFHVVDRPYHGKKYENPELIDLLTVYATQFGSYNTLLWQVPALSLTAQAFLLTIALNPDSSTTARLITAVLSMIIAVASTHLMHDQRGHAINHGELARRLSKQLDLANHLDGNFELNDAKPEKTDGEDVWRAVDHGIYAIWKGCMWLFLGADILVIVVTLGWPSLLKTPLH